MLKENFVIQSNVRQILIRSNIDYSRITFGTVKGGLSLRGVFKSARLHTDGSGEGAANFTIKSLESLEKKITDIRGVIDIEFDRFLLRHGICKPRLCPWFDVPYP